MLQLGQLLERFKNLPNIEKIKKQLVVEVFCKNNIPIKIEQISIQKNTLFIKTNPILKTEIFLKKEEILEQIKKNSGLITLRDIK